MPIKKKVTDHFTYISYTRESYNDVTGFKRALENLLGKTAADRDVVVDLSASSGVSSSEIGLLIRLLNSFKGTARFLRIVGNEQITKTLLLTKIDKLGNLVIYKDQEEFVKKVKELGAG